MGDEDEKKFKNLHFEILELPTSAEHVRNVIQKRLDYADSLAGVEPGSTIRIDDSGYKAICELSHESIGLALEVLRRVLPIPEQLAKRPYVITGERVNALGITYENLCEYWDSPLRGATVLELKPW